MVKKANNKPGFNGSDKDQRTVQLSALFAALPDNYFLIDQQGTILNYRVRSGVSLIDDPVAYIGSNVADILPPAPSALFKEHMRQQHDAQDVVTWEYHIDLEGKRWDREAHLCPLSGSDEMVLVVRDITKRRQAERERAEAEERLERIISNLPGAVISKKFENSEYPQVVYASPQTSDIWGVSADDMCNIKGLTEPMVNTNDLKTYAEHVSRALENFESYSFRYRITTHTGENKWLETNTRAYKHEDGYTYTDGFVLDVTKEVIVQKQLETQRKIADRAQKLDSIGQLTGGMAHDFNNLLAAIMFSLELLRDDETDEQNLAMIDNSLTAAKHGAELTRSMLAFASKASLDPSVIDLNRLVTETRSWAGRTLPSNIEVKTSLSTDLGPIMADVSSTESALLNLLVNARDAMPDGG
ncbi:hybrid sensor histidine kinase/response regulator [Parasedimentitalea maritima]|uniref:histidine kinase n=1 Tax=Parasedimentitalea maritima TaxID=2578117 RepID=A0A6A4RFT7_9RHOB|nr:hybrid sensor histidine kinase/response regulator [Zongyanglinia marina]KAE9627879.1 PAS domain S-box protein [Zongyanglinia marina]